MHTKARWKIEKEWHDRNAQIVAMRLDKLTYREIGEHFDISQERVRQIIYKHMRLLRNEPYLTHRAKYVIRLLLSQHQPLEVLRINGVGRHTLDEIKRWMSAGGSLLGGWWTK